MDVGVTPPERRRTMRLRDGRTLAWSEWGHADGLPVLFCTGAAMSGWLGFGATAVEDLGLRLMAIDRPGLGASAAHPDKTLLSWVSDVREVIWTNGLTGGVTAVGFSQGAPFALAIARHDLVEAVAIVSGQDELASPSISRLLHPDVAEMIRSVIADVSQFEQLFAAMATPDSLWHLVLEMSSERDRAVYLDPVFSEAYRQSLREGFSQGARGYARDLALTLGTWPFGPEHITVPVDLWYGGADTSTVHSPDFGATLAGRLPNASRTVDAAEGGSILWTRSHDILATLKSRRLARSATSG